MRNVLLVCLCLLTLVAAAACSPEKAPEPAPLDPEDTLILGFSQLGSESGWRIGNTRSIMDAAARAGVELMFDNAEQKQEKQIKAIRSFIAYQVDVIAFPPIVEEGWDNVLAEAKRAGIPVLLVDRDIKTDDESLYAGFIGSDFAEEGRKAGRFLKEWGKDKEAVRIVEITGTVDSTPMRMRSSGFLEQVGGDPKYQILESISGDFLRSKGKECMRLLIAQHPQIDVLYSHNDAMTLGAIEAIEDAGLVPGRDICIITVDGEQAAIDLLIEGKINCVVECTPMLGDTVMELAKKLKNGEEIPRITYSEERVFTQDDPDLRDLPPRGY